MDIENSSQQDIQDEKNEGLSLPEEATSQVFERYISQIKSLIRMKLNERIRRKEGTSDIAQAVFKSFFECNVDLSDSDNLLGVLLTITYRKIVNTVHKYQGPTRDYRREQIELNSNTLVLSSLDLERMASGPSPEDAVVVMDLLEHLIECLQEREQQVLKLKLLAKDHSNKEVAKMLKVPLNSDGYFLEAHVKLRPVDFATEGIFVAGLAHSPKFISEAVSQAAAAAARASTILAKDKYYAEATVSYVDDTLCVGCAVCSSLCPYEAIELATEEDDRRHSRVNEALCKGCGTCVAACPSGAMDQYGFTRRQIMAMIDTVKGW